MKLSLETMQNISQANLHTVSYGEETIAGMRCEWLSNGEVLQLGDIVYGYYSQTDGFTIYDVIEINDNHAVMQEIDCDGVFDQSEAKLSKTLLIVGPTRFDTFYRPNPEDRKQIENEGFYSASFSRFGGNQMQKRKLAIRIHPYVDNTKKENNSNDSFLLVLTLMFFFILIGFFSFS